MKGRSEIWLAALEELGNQCSVDTARDAETCVRRAAQEGDSFFKVTLPQFAKELESSLAAGHIPTTSFTGWGRRNRNVFVVSDDSFIADNEAYDSSTLFQFKTGGGIPKFLGGFLELVFADDRVISKSTWDGALEWLLHEATEGEVPNLVRHTVQDLLPPALFDILSDSIEGKLDREYITPNETRAIEDAADAIHAIRQLCLMFSKEKELPAQRDIDNAIARFVEIDEELEETLMQGVDLTLRPDLVHPSPKDEEDDGLPGDIEALAKHERFESLAESYRAEQDKLGRNEDEK